MATCLPLSVIMPQYKTAHRIKNLTDLLLQLFNLFIIKSCQGFKETLSLTLSLPLNYKHLNSRSVAGSSHPMQAHFLFTSSIIKSSVWGGYLKKKLHESRHYLHLQVPCQNRNRKLLFTAIMLCLGEITGYKVSIRPSFCPLKQSQPLWYKLHC